MDSLYSRDYRKGAYAHSRPGRPVEEWEPLSHHLRAVAERAAGFAANFGFDGMASVAGLLHDIGKRSATYLNYISAAPELGGSSKGPDHSTAGAREAVAIYPKIPGRMLAYTIAGHHAGLTDGDDLDRRLDPARKVIESYHGWREDTGPLPDVKSLAPARQPAGGGPHGFAQAFLTRMIFSCLVDADFLATEAFYEAGEGRAENRAPLPSLETLRCRLSTHMARLAAEAPDTPVNALRRGVLDHALSKAPTAPGLFTLTVPTGGGKTLVSLAFAMEHAAVHGLRRVIYVAPFTSIIEQTAQVFRRALNTEDGVLEHHTSFDWEAFERRTAYDAGTDGEGPSGVEKLRKAAENWDAPVVVTTSVQFFESLYAARPSPCRKLHNLAKAVIVLDEAQVLPPRLLRPCLAAIRELAANYGASVVLCTATQPAVTNADGFAGGLDIPPERELAPNPEALYERLDRVAVERAPAAVEDRDIAARFASAPAMLCIVNARAHAADLHASIRDLPGAVHLSTLMVPRHRRQVLDDVRRRLREGMPVRLVATSLIEAGVDVDFPEVWRAVAGLDSIAQAAGRCNREGKLGRRGGRVVVFDPAARAVPRDLKDFVEAARGPLRRHKFPLAPQAIRAYFQELFWQKGPDSLDAATLDERPFPILADIAARAPGMSYRFGSIARAFRLIDETLVPVVVPWRAAPDDNEAIDLLQRIAAMERPRSTDLRATQQYTVPIPPNLRSAWLAAGVLRPVNPRLGDALLAIVDPAAHYDPHTGLRIGTPDRRAPESNVF